ncbi:MAG: DMT family transporter [Eubacteriales bacterium]
MTTEENKLKLIEPADNRLRGNITLLVTALIWGAAFVAQSVGMDYIGPFTFNFVRSMIGGLVLIPSLFFLDKMKLTQVPHGRAQVKQLAVGGIICGVLLFIASSAQQIGIITTSAGKSGFITALYIVLVPVIGIFLGHRSSVLVWTGVVAATVGLYLLCVNEAFAISKGDIMVMICALFFSFHILTIDYFAAKVDCVRMSCIQFFVTGLLSGILAFIFEHPDLQSIWDGRISILYAGVLSSGVAYTLQIVGQRETKPVIASLILSLESVFAALAGVVLLGESFTYRELLGCILILVAIIMAQMKDIRFRKNTLS